MVVSRVEVVGQVELPAGATWDEVIRSPADRSIAMVAFLAIAGRRLRRHAGEVQLNYMMHIPGVSNPPGKPYWHRDSSFQEGQVAAVLGEPTTEFLLGSYPESYLEPGAPLEELVRRLEPWQPQPGDCLWYDRYAIHRSPLVIRELTAARIFLLASPPVRDMVQSTTPRATTATRTG